MAHEERQEEIAGKAQDVNKSVAMALPCSP